MHPFPTTWSYPRNATSSGHSSDCCMGRSFCRCATLLVRMTSKCHSTLIRLPFTIPSRVFLILHVVEVSQSRRNIHEERVIVQLHIKNLPKGVLGTSRCDFYILRSIDCSMAMVHVSQSVAEVLHRSPQLNLEPGANARQRRLHVTVSNFGHQGAEFSLSGRLRYGITVRKTK
jgi:hypothetical protein